MHVAHATLQDRKGADGLNTLQNKLALQYSRNLKKHQHLPRELAQIVDEVNQHGFYSTTLDEFMPDISDREEQMYMILMIAKKAQLTVSFNLEKNLCLFE